MAAIILIMCYVTIVYPVHPYSLDFESILS